MVCYRLTEKEKLIAEGIQFWLKPEGRCSFLSRWLKPTGMNRYARSGSSVWNVSLIAVCFGVE